MTTETDVKDLLPEKKSEAVKLVDSLKASHLAHAAEFQGVNPKEAQEIFAGFMFCCKKNPTILRCTQSSILIALSHCVQFKLYPGARQECALIPRKNKETQRYELDFQPMTLGIIKHAYDSKFVTRIDSEAFYENDFIEYQQGTKPELTFRKNIKSDRGKKAGAYAVIQLVNGEVIIEVMSYAEIERVRKCAQTQKVWEQNWEEMARKTVVKRALKRVRRSDSLAEVIEYDNSLERPDLALENKARAASINDMLGDVSPTGLLEEGSEGVPADDSSEATAAAEQAA